MYKIVFHSVSRAVKKALDKEFYKQTFAKTSQMTLHEADEILNKLCEIEPQQSKIKLKKEESDTFNIEILLIDELTVNEYVILLKVDRNEHSGIVEMILDDISSKDSIDELGSDVTERLSDGIVAQYQNEEKELESKKTGETDFAELEELDNNYTQHEGTAISDEGLDDTKRWQIDNQSPIFAENIMAAPDKEEPPIRGHDEDVTVKAKNAEGVSFPAFIDFVSVPEGIELYEQAKERWNTEYLLKCLEIPGDSILSPLEEKKRDFALSILTGPKFSALMDKFSQEYNTLITNTSNYLSSSHKKAVDIDYPREAKIEAKEALNEIDGSTDADIEQFIKQKEIEMASACKLFDNSQQSKLESYRKQLEAESVQFRLDKKKESDNLIEAYRKTAKLADAKKKQDIINESADELRYKWNSGLTDARRSAISTMRRQFNIALENMQKEVENLLESINSEIEGKIHVWKEDIAENEKNERLQNINERRNRKLEIQESKANGELECLNQTAAHMTEAYNKAMSETTKVFENSMHSVEEKMSSYLDLIQSVSEKQRENAKACSHKILARVGGVLLCLVIAGGCAFGAYSFSNYQHSIESSINDLQEQVDTYQDTISSQQAEIGELEGQLQSAEESISIYSSKVSEMETQLSESENRNSEYAQQISTMQEEIDALSCGDGENENG